LARAYGHPIELDRDAWDPVGPRPIVRRLLNNLLGEYVRRGDFRRALAAVERMQIVLPTIDDIRQRGLLLYRLGRPADAEHELSEYLANSGDETERADIEQHLRWIRRLRASMN